MRTNTIDKDTMVNATKKWAEECGKSNRKWCFDFLTSMVLLRLLCTFRKCDDGNALMLRCFQLLKRCLWQDVWVQFFGWLWFSVVGFVPQCDTLYNNHTESGPRKYVCTRFEVKMCAIFFCRIYLFVVVFLFSFSCLSL